MTDFIISDFTSLQKSVQLIKASFHNGFLICIAKLLAYPPPSDKTLMFFFSVLCLLGLCARLFICALWSPAGKGLTSWLLLVVSNCEFVTFPLVS